MYNCYINIICFGALSSLYIYIYTGACVCMFLCMSWGSWSPQDILRGFPTSYFCEARYLPHTSVKTHIHQLNSNKEICKNVG